ncbi:MAG TPA: hypothetical protein PKW55_04880 [Spirochaetota bacterium]|nr:hypothetical protein [Spirochaetota bacterium]HOM37714.1 hypothetical protein [Spirochaetota bacterium]HPQ49672.1 hypothetical protein [Spirochaetota bacterium]
MFKKIFPMIVVIIIPIIILTSLIFMIKRRVFIFKEDFLNQANTITENISNEFRNILKKDLILKINTIETFFKERESEIKEEDIKIFIKNQIFDSIILENILITDNEINIKYSFSEPHPDTIKWLKWALSSNLDLVKDDITKIFVNKEKIILYRKISDKMFFLVGDFNLFYNHVKNIYQFLNKGLTISANAIFINLDNETFNKNTNLLISLIPQLSSTNKMYQIEIEGSYLMYKNINIKLREEPVLNTILLVYCDPKEFPLNIIHKIILLIVGAFLILISIISAVRIKYEIDKSQIENYETEDFLSEKMLSIADEEDEPKEFKKPLDKEDEEEEETYEIPDDYFTKPREEKKPKDKELVTIIEEVEEQEESAKKYESLWKNINSLLENVQNYSIMLFLRDEIGNFVPHFSKNSVNVDIKNENWIFKYYIENGKSLFVPDNAYSVTPVKELFNNEPIENLKSLFISPIIENIDGNNLINGLIILLGENINESIIREINDLINLG